MIKCKDNIERRKGHKRVSRIREKRPVRSKQYINVFRYRAENMSRAVKYICERSNILLSRRAVDDVR